MTNAILIPETKQVILDYEHPVYSSLYPCGSTQVTVSFVQYLAWVIVVRYLSHNGKARNVLTPNQKSQAYMRGDGFGKLDDDALLEIGWDWSHIRDSSYGALCEIAEFIFAEHMHYYSDANSFTDMAEYLYNTHINCETSNPLNLFDADCIYDSLSIADTNEATFSVVLTGAVKTSDSGDLVPALKQCLGDWDAAQLEHPHPIILKGQITKVEAQSLKTCFEKYGAVIEIQNASA